MTDHSVTKKYDRQIRTIGSEAQKWYHPIKFTIRIHQKDVFIASSCPKYNILHSELEKNLILLGFLSVGKKNLDGDDDRIILFFEENGVEHLECSLEVSKQDIKIALCSLEKEKQEIASFKGVCSQRHM